jgi:plastocyanin
VSVGKQHLPWVVCAVMFVVGVPALASGEERAPAPADAAMTVHDNYFQDASTPGTADHDVSITTGGKVTFAYGDDGSSSAAHNVAFRDGPQPAACKQTVGSDIDPDDTPPLPDGPQGVGWGGYCTFDAPGTYSFYCQVHGGMEGTIEVTGSATPTATPTATATPTPTPTPPAAAARVDAHDSGARNYWQERGSADTDNSVTVKPGERVAFAFPAGASVHNLEFKSSPAPASCPQTKAPAGFALDADDAPPMPAFATAAGWEGYCTFPAAGTYAFVCGVHPEMTGSVVVQADATPTQTATATPAQTATAVPPRRPRPRRLRTWCPRPRRPRPRRRGAEDRHGDVQALQAHGHDLGDHERDRQGHGQARLQDRQEGPHEDAHARDQGREVQRHAQAPRARREAGRQAVGDRQRRGHEREEDRVRQAMSASRRCRRSCAASSISLWRHSDAR